MDRLDALRAFASVADLQSFAAAARRLRWSPAAVTRAVAGLEAALEVTLLSRTTRSVRLTERGTLYLERCRQILQDMEDADRLVRGEDAEPRGRMVVTAPILFGRLHILPIVERMLRDHPALAIRLHLSDQPAHLVEEGIDVAVRIGDLADSALVAVRLGEIRRVVVASPVYLERRGIPRHPAELANHDVIAFEGLGPTREWRFGGPDSPTVRIEPRLAVNTAEATIVAALDGLGITRTLSYQVYEAVTAGTLRLVLEDFAPAPQPVSALYPARRLGTANVAAFVRAARRHFHDHPLEFSAPP